MANNPYVNKVVYGNQTVIDLSGDTADASDVLQGQTFHDRSGALVTGTAIGGVPEEELRDTVGWTGKNLLGVYIGKAWNSSGVLTDTSDAISSAKIPVTPGDKFIASKNATIGTGRGMLVRMFDSTGTYSSSDTILSDTATSNTFTVPANVYYIGVTQYFTNTATVSEQNTYEVMLRYASISDITYEPYHDSVEEVVEQVYADNGVLGAKNLLENKATTQTVEDVIYTVNADGTISLSGTASGNSTITVNQYTGAELKAMGSSLTFTGGVNQLVYLILRKSDWTAIAYAQGSYRTDTFSTTSLEDNVTYYITAAVTSGQSASGMTFYPMLRLATDTDDTYQPYAMTNKELTDNKADNTDLDEWTATSQVDSNGVVSFSSLDTSLSYKLFYELPSGDSAYTYEKVTLNGTTLSFTTNAPSGTVCKLRILK